MVHVEASGEAPVQVDVVVVVAVAVEVPDIESRFTGRTGEHGVRPDGRTDRDSARDQEVSRRSLCVQQDVRGLCIPDPWFIGSNGCPEAVDVGDVVHDAEHAVRIRVPIGSADVAARVRLLLSVLLVAVVVFDVVPERVRLSRLVLWVQTDLDISSS